MAEGSISTTIDALLDYLRSNGETSSTVLASSLGVGEDVVTQLAKVLESADKVKITYKLGKMFIVPEKEEGGIDIKSAVQAKVDLSMRAESHEAVLGRITARVNQLNISVDTVEKLFKEKHGSIKEALDRMYEVEKRATESQKKVTQRVNEIDKLNTKVAANLESLKNYAGELGSFSLEKNTAQNVIEDIKQKMDLYSESIKGMQKKMEDTIHDYRKSYMKLSESMVEEEEKLRQIINQEEKQLREYQNYETQYKHEAERVMKNFEKEREVALDEIVKSKKYIDRLAIESDKNMDRIKGMVAEVKKTPGVDLNSRINDVKTELKTANQEKDSVAKEIRALKEGLKTSKKTKSGATMVDEAKLESQSKEIEDKLKELDTSTAELNSKFEDIGR